MLRRLWGARQILIKSNRSYVIFNDSMVSQYIKYARVMLEDAGSIPGHSGRVFGGHEKQEDQCALI